ncbi:unnamed protein product [Trichobilharzia regenti]|nr:unnamed protein product [Trichobilharzia regenti]
MHFSFLIHNSILAALNIYGKKLTSFERDEILNFSKIWYLGLSAQKIEGIVGSPSNHGYDDETGGYLKVCLNIDLLFTLSLTLFCKLINVFFVFFILFSSNLYDLLRKNDFRGFTIHSLKKITVKLLTCLCLLRKQGIIHCDLKPVS